MAAAPRQRSRASSANRWGRSRAGRARRWSDSGNCSVRCSRGQGRPRIAVIDQHLPLLDDLAAYALGALEETERARVEAHLATCDTCPRLLAEYRAVVGVLPNALEPEAPPTSAWRAIRAEARQRVARERHGPSVPSGSRWWRWTVRPTMAVMIAGLVIWNVMLQRELARRAPGPAPGPEVEALSRRPGQVVILSGSGVPGASARLFVASDGGHGHLAISGLPPLSDRKSTRLNSSHLGISYAVFCLKKKRE